MYIRLTAQSFHRDFLLFGDFTLILEEKLEFQIDKKIQRDLRTVYE